MTVQVIGTTFQNNSQWHQNELQVIDNVRQQINLSWPESENLLINTTWFGPQFDTQLYHSFNNYRNIDNLFFLSTVDPVMLNSDQLQVIVDTVEAKNVFYLGNFDTQYQFTFIATLLPKYFQIYSESDLVLKNPNWIFINYNRKPRQHRVDLVTKLLDNDLVKYGITTLGKNDPSYSKKTSIISLLPDENDYSIEGNWGIDNSFGITHDIHTLGNITNWQQHFLNIISETEFLPWNHMFITEKTWKPILGLRPFVLNGQTKIYQYLRNQGFRTFNHYWDHIELEQANEFEVHDSIVAVVRYLSTLNNTEILSMYRDMLPDLRHNRLRFFEFAQEQQYRIENLFQ